MKHRILDIGHFRIRASHLRRVCSTALLLLACTVSVAVGQVQDSTELRRFRMADSFLRSGQYEKAIGILESLYEQSPGNSSFYRKLKDAYEGVKRYDDAIRLVEQKIEKNPSPHLLSEKARLLYQKGDEEAAERTWTAAIERAPNRTVTYRVVYQTLVSIRRYDRAIDVLQQARRRMDDSSLFRSELAYLYGLSGEHRKAMEEYVVLLDQSPNRFSLVRSRLQTFVDQGEGTDASTEVLRNAVEDRPLNSSYRRLLAWLYMKTDNYGDAYDVYRALDRLEQKNGQILYTFAEKAADAEQFAVATEAFEAILERYPDAEVAPRSQKALGNTYRKWAQAKTSPGRADSLAQYDAARDAYRTFLDEYPSHQAYPEILAQLGTLQLDIYRDLDAAEETLQEVVSAFPKSAAANRARYDLGRIALLKGNLERARLLFSRLADRLRSGDLADRARFEIALLHFYQGRFDAAQTQAKATSGNTSADVANDAIELSVLIQENRGPDSLNTALKRYARAKLDLRRHRYADADARLDSLIQQNSRHPLADEARFKRAQTLLALGDTTRAVDRYRDLAKQYPRSPYADRSLFRLGTLHEKQGHSKRAIALYDRLLTEYPRSLLASDARSRLRTLRRAQS